MKNEDVKVGDKIRVKSWKKDVYWEILAIGKYKFFYRDTYGNEESGDIVRCSGTIIWPDMEFYKPKKNKVKLSRALVLVHDRVGMTNCFYKAIEDVKKDMEEFYVGTIQVVQWPLKINGVEQWVEVEELI